MKYNWENDKDNELLEYADVISELAQFSVPDPTPAMTERLLERARQGLPRPRMFSGEKQSSVLVWLKPVVQQVSVFEKRFWLASFFVLALGLFVSLSDPSSMYLSLLAPGMAALGVAYSFRGQGTLEIELTCPVTPYQIVLGRMLMIFGYNTIVGLTGSALLVGLNSGLIFSALVLEWLAPMLLLIGIAMVTVIWFNSLVSVSSSMLLWGAILAYRFNLFGFAYGQWVNSLVTPQVMTLSGLVLILAGFYSSRYMWDRPSERMR